MFQARHCKKASGRLVTLAVLFLKVLGSRAELNAQELSVRLVGPIGNPSYRIKRAGESWSAAGHIAATGSTLIRTDPEGIQAAVLDMES